MSDYWKKFQTENVEVIRAANMLAEQQNKANEEINNLPEQERYFDRSRWYSVSFHKEVLGKRVYISDWHRTIHLAFKKDPMVCPVIPSAKQFEVDLKKWKYGQALRRKTTNNRTFAKHKPTQLMGYLEAYRIFINDYLHNAFIAQDGKRFKIDPRNELIIVHLLKYFIRDKDCRIPLNKGIALIGGVGTGKTTLLRQFAKFTKDNDLQTQFEFVKMSTIQEEMKKNGSACMNKYQHKDICIDEFADEESRYTNSYGEKIDCVKQSIKKRYERFEKGNAGPTHLTSNIDFELEKSVEENINSNGVIHCRQAYPFLDWSGLSSNYKPTEDQIKNIKNQAKQFLNKQYGQREMDRMRQMYTFIWLGGPSRR